VNKHSSIYTSVSAMAKTTEQMWSSLFTINSAYWVR